MRLPEQLRSTTFRLAVGYTLLFLVSVLAMLAVAYLAATKEVEGIVRRSIEEDVRRFEAVAVSGGTAALAADVRARAEGAPDDRFYLLADASGKRIEGNIPEETWQEGWRDRELPRSLIEKSASLVAAAALNSDREVRLFGFGREIGGMRMLVARNSHILDETQEILLASLLWGATATTVLALVGGYLVSLGPTRRVDAIAARMRMIVAGRFDVRLPRHASRDELDRLSRDINAMLDRIEVLVSSLKQVSTDIAHDLRTPLARLRQRLEGTLRTARGASDYEAALDGAIGEVDTIIETFNALLRIAQIEAGARKAKFAEVDLSALLTQLFDVFESVAEDAGHAMSADVAPGLLLVGDRDLLTQLFSNLIENAVTHVPPPGRIVVGARIENGRVVATISDDGPGVPEEERRRIFRRLYRLDASRSTPGSGLGLSLAEAIAELHEARIEAEDNRPGLRMRVVFEALAPDEAVAARPARPTMRGAEADA